MNRIIRFWKTWRVARQSQAAKKLIWQLDESMVRLGYSRQRRRGFWREFVKSDGLRLEVFKDFSEIKHE